MKKIAIQVTFSIIACVLIVILVVVSVNTWHTKNVLTNELEKKLFYYTEAYAYKFSEGFTQQQELVDNMKIYVSNSFLMSDYDTDKDLFQEKHNYLDKTIREFAETNPKLAGVYFTFDTSISKGKDEIWYARLNDTIVKADYNEFGDMWEVSNSVTESSYYNALKQSPIWGDIYYEPVLKAQVLSYVTAVYDAEDRLIGVAGVDIEINDILDDVKNIKSNNRSSAVLVDKNMNYITGSMSQETYDNLKSLDEFQTRLQSEEKTNIIEYKLDGQKYITAYAPLKNGWTFIMSQPDDTVFESIRNIRNVIIICAVILIILSALFAFFYSKRKLQPIVHEYEEKDIFLHSQARSAKLGSMISNIAHQWKQPLNSMTINITNMSDDFRDGNLNQNDMDEYTKILKKTIDSMSHTVDDFANFLKPDKDREVFDIKDEIDQVLSIISPMINKQSIIISIHGPDIKGYGYKNEYIQVLFNVLSNCVDALSNIVNAKKKIEIRTESIDDDMSAVKIFNNGSRISQQILDKIFDPYFSTKSKKRGTGLGLYMSREIIEKNMNGKINIINTDKGVECTIIIPGKEHHDLFE